MGFISKPPFLLEQQYVRVTITYYDEDSLTVEEVEARAKRNYGKYVQVEVKPSSSSPQDYIYFALQQIITHEQLSLLFDDKSTYPTKIEELRSNALALLQQELSAVIKDNELKSK